MSQPTPPGYPLGYTLQTHKFLCAGCGRTEQFEVMNTMRRTGASSKAYAMTGARETIYDLPIQETNTQWVTPRCKLCIDELPKTEVPRLPPLRERLKPRWAAAQISTAELEELGLL